MAVVLFFFSFVEFWTQFNEFYSLCSVRVILLIYVTSGFNIVLIVKFWLDRACKVSTELRHAYLVIFTPFVVCVAHFFRLQCDADLLVILDAQSSRL